MGVFDFLLKSKIKSIINDNPNGYNYQSEKFGNIVIPEKLTESNAFKLSNLVPEIYFPIDFYADRCSKLRYYIADKQGKEIENTELNRFILNPNPFYSLNDLIYQYVFSYMSDGNAITYLGIPSSYKNISVNSIDRVDVLQPDLLLLNEYTNLSIIKIKSLNELIKEARYFNFNGFNDILNKDYLRFDRIDSIKKETSNILSRSPLFKASKSIDLLLAVYSARYNVYTNNGAAGYLVKKQTNTNINEVAIDEPVNRQRILDEIKDRNGLTGNKNILGISSVPIEFIKTLATISELMPLEETLENSIKIASIWQIPPELCPRKDQTTFNNKAAAELSVWENGIMSMINTVCDNFTKIFTLDKLGLLIKADYSSISCLSANELTKEDVKTKKIANLAAIKSSYPQKETEINKELDKIILSYGN